MKRDFGFVFWSHLILIILAWLSPLWIDWRLIFIGILLLSIQYTILGGCYLTFLETGKDKDMTFYFYHLSKFFPSLNKRKTKLFIRYVLPAILLVIAYVLQVFYGWTPLLKLWF